MQQQLQRMGLYQGEIDGIVGPQTQQAVRYFQQRQGLPQTATVDQQAMSQIMQGSGSATGAGTGTGVGTGTGAGQPAQSSPTPGVGGSGGGASPGAGGTR